jgi:hypothetical protein
MKRYLVASRQRLIAPGCGVLTHRLIRHIDLRTLIKMKHVTSSRVVSSMFERQVLSECFFSEEDCSYRFYLVSAWNVPRFYGG